MAELADGPIVRSTWSLFKLGCDFMRAMNCRAGEELIGIPGDPGLLDRLDQLEESLSILQSRSIEDELGRVFPRWRRHVDVRSRKHMSTTLDPGDADKLRSLMEVLLQRIEKEVERQPVLFLPARDAPRVEELLDNPIMTFVSDAGCQEELPEHARNYIRRSAYCLAADLRHAAAQQAFVAAESILRAYVEVVTGSAPRVKKWSELCILLERGGVTDELVTQLRALGDERNEMMHPGLDVDAARAQGAWEWCRDVCSSMLGDMHARRARAASTHSPTAEFEPAEVDDVDS